jgi:hypothetical protein
MSASGVDADADMDVLDFEICSGRNLFIWGGGGVVLGE